MTVNREVRFRPKPFHPFAARRCLPLIRGKRTCRLGFGFESDRRERLEESDEEERHFVVCKLRTVACVRLFGVIITLRYYLLTQTNAWTGIEREENKRVRSQVSLNPVVKEPIGVKFLGSRSVSLGGGGVTAIFAYHPVPIDPFSGA